MKNVVYFGNSHMADNNSGVHTLSRGVMTWANTQLGWNVLANKGIVNNTVAQILARVNNDLLIFKPDYAAMLMLATNSINQKVPTATIISQLAQLFSLVQAAGIKIITATDIPRVAFNAAQKQSLLEVNSWLLTQASCSTVVADFYSRAADNNGNALPLWLRDGTHLSALGAGTLGLEILAPKLLQDKSTLVPGLLVNVVPKGARLAGTGTFTVIGSTLNMVYTAAADQFALTYTVPKTSLSIGDKIVFEVDVTVTGTGVRNVGIRAQSGAQYVYAMHPSNDVGQYGNWSGRLKTAPITLTSTSISLSAIGITHAAGNSSVQINNISGYKS